MDAASARLPDYEDRPFGVPPDVVLDLPTPPSVNNSRKVDWAWRAKHRQWVKDADVMLIAGRMRSRDPIPKTKLLGRYEAIITLSEFHTKMDLDNCIKAVIDYARRVEIVIDDSPKYLRRLTVEWGSAPMGCRLTLRPMA